MIKSGKYFFNEKISEDEKILNYRLNLSQVIKQTTFVSRLILDFFF